MKNLIALICVAALITVITGCSESIYSEQNGGNSQSPESAKMPGIEADLNPEQPKETLQPLESAETPKIEQEARINTELLSEFGMTLSELEEKYGAVTGRIPAGVDFDYIDSERNIRTFINHNYTFFFENSDKGFNFPVFESESDRTLTDGTLLPCSNARYQESYDLRVRDLFLGVEEPMKIGDFINAISHTGGYETMLMPTDDPWFVPFDAILFPFVTGFWYSYSYSDYDFNIQIEHAEEGIISPSSYLKIRTQ